jgi:hypothetical protein
MRLMTWLSYWPLPILRDLAAVRFGLRDGVQAGLGVKVVKGGAIPIMARVFGDRR